MNIIWIFFVEIVIFVQSKCYHYKEQQAFYCSAHCIECFREFLFRDATDPLEYSSTCTQAAYKGQ